MKKEHQDLLLGLARAAIVQTLEAGCAPLPDLNRLPPELREPAATFVTLTLDGSLRGCIGMLAACRPLAHDVAANACAAAFEDPRFSPLTRAEFDQIELQISVLSSPEELYFSSEEEALQQIRPGIDGVILQDRSHRGTFLPSVWDELPDRALFWRHLKRKAGLLPAEWPTSLRVFRYTAECFSQNPQ
jgi:AmmeMemoRadiSam system protein A